MTRGDQVYNRTMAGIDLGPQELAALAKRILQGDSSAEDELARLFSERVLMMTLVRVRDPEAARDLTQEAMLAVLRALRNGQVREPERLAGFVHGTALNLIHNYFRTRGQQPKQEPLPDELPSSNTIGSAEGDERISLVRQALKRLDSIDRRILLLTLVEGMKPGEIARELGLKPDLVRQRKCRAVRKVIEQMRRLSRKWVEKPRIQVGGP